MEIRFSQSARKHKVAKGRALEVMATVEPTVYVRPSDGAEGRKWIGVDSRGLELEILGVVKTNRNTGEPMVLIIHVMPTDLRTS